MSEQYDPRAGWLALYKSDVSSEDVQGDERDMALSLDLRALRTGQRGLCTDATADQLETRPRPRYTMATLLIDLTRVAKYIRDERLRAALQEKDRRKAGEHGGIGTPATRDSIIATLFERGYLVEQGKSIVSTPTGRQFYDTLPDQAKYPDMTALWHEQQKAIQAGERDVWFSACEMAPATLSARVGNFAGDRGEAARRGIAARVSIHQRRAQPGS